MRVTAVYLAPDERERSAGTFDAKRVVERAARVAEEAVRNGGWIDPSHGRIKPRRERRPLLRRGGEDRGYPAVSDGELQGPVHRPRRR